MPDRNVLEAATQAQDARALLERLFPICRSITGDGVRETLAILRQTAPWNVNEYASGTKVYDWTIPHEWKIRDAWIADRSGKRIVDFRVNNLHVVGYSAPVRERMTFEALRPHLHTLPDQPDAIPYRTSYYKAAWGFCLTQRQLDAMDRKGEYEVVIDSEFNDGSMTLADCVLPGVSGREFLVSTYCCHPSMANDNLSGTIVTTLLLRELASRPKLRHSWRFVTLPETIGAIAYLAHHEAAMKKVSGGFVISTCGGPGKFGYKETFRGDDLIDRVTALVFRDRGIEPLRYRFDPHGSDERQYSSPGFRIPIGLITKDKYYEYPFYHTSKDNIDFVTGEAMAETLSLYVDAVDMIEDNRVPLSLNPHGEVQLGPRGLYPTTGGTQKTTASTAEAQLDATLWLLFLADGKTDLVTMAEKSGVAFRDIAAAARTLEAQGLVREIAPPQCNRMEALYLSGRTAQLPETAEATEFLP